MIVADHSSLTCSKMRFVTVAVLLMTVAYCDAKPMFEDVQTCNKINGCSCQWNGNEVIDLHSL